LGSSAPNWYRSHPAPLSAQTRWVFMDCQSAHTTTIPRFVFNINIDNIDTQHTQPLPQPHQILQLCRRRVPRTTPPEVGQNDTTLPLDRWHRLATNVPRHRPMWDQHQRRHEREPRNRSRRMEGWHRGKAKGPKRVQDGAYSPTGTLTDTDRMAAHFFLGKLRA
jgi:hypothetical protein